MKNKRKKQSFLVNLVFSKFFLFFCIIIFVVILFGIAKGTVKNYYIDSEIIELQEEIAHLERKNEDFKQLINYLKTDSFVEQEAKLKLGYKKPGEHLVVIQDQNKTSYFNQINEPDKAKEISNPAKWWAYFFK